MPTLRAALSDSTRPTWAPPRWPLSSPDANRRQRCHGKVRLWLPDGTPLQNPGRWRMIAFFGGQPKTLRQVPGLGARSIHYQVLLSPSGCIRHCALMILLAGSPARAPSESPESDHDRTSSCCVCSHTVDSPIASRRSFRQTAWVAAFALVDASIFGVLAHTFSSLRAVLVTAHSRCFRDFGIIGMPRGSSTVFLLLR